MQAGLENWDHFLFARPPHLRDLALATTTHIFDREALCASALSSMLLLMLLSYQHIARALPSVPRAVIPPPCLSCGAARNPPRGSKQRLAMRQMQRDKCFGRTLEIEELALLTTRVAEPCPRATHPRRTIRSRVRTRSLVQMAGPKLTNTGKQASPRVEVYYPLPYNSTGLAGNKTIKVHGIVPTALANFAFYASPVRSQCHDLKSFEGVLLSIEKEPPKRRGPLTRRFIITGCIFGEDGAIAHLPKLIELKHKHKYRFLLDESISFGTVGRTGRGLTELYNVPATQIDMIVGSVANGLNSSGGFCAGSHIVVDHQRIIGTSFVFSAAVPALMAVSASEGINILRNTPSILRRMCGRSGPFMIASPSLTHAASPIIHIHLRSSAPAASVSAKPSNLATPAPREAPSFDIVGEERLLQDIVDEGFAQGVWMARAHKAAQAGAG
ncbi:pyridoxal phosphate-dependent transferase [Lactarius hatsudake]|nr:pyridoxal phosphate-dependent transferase [Lactarius hatsudake]